MDTKLEPMNEPVAGSYIADEWMEKVVETLDGTPNDDVSCGFLTAMAFLTCSEESNMHGTSAPEFLANARLHLMEEREREIMRSVIEALSAAMNGGEE